MLEAIAKSIVIVIVTLTGCATMTWVERKIVARTQARYGPNRTGPFGLLQPLADALKLLFKEELIPARADRILFILAPIVAVTPPLLLLAVVPLGATVNAGGTQVALSLTDINVAVIYVCAIASLSVYGVILAGWASNNPYASLGGLRSTAQMLSYQLPQALAVVGVLLLSGSMSLNDIVLRQMTTLQIDGKDVGVWFIFLQPVAGLVFLLTALVETDRAPFDPFQDDHALIASYHTEYSGVKFALFFVARYVKMIAISALAVTLFFGGWLPPFANLLGGLWERIGGFSWLSPLWFGGKVLALLVLLVWLRAALSRLSSDRLVSWGWKVLLPLSLLNIVVTAGLMVLL